jgi:exonuclease VII small subunit
MENAKKEFSEIVAIIENMSVSERREVLALLQGMKLSKELAETQKTA